MWACSAVDVLMVYILYSELTQKIDTLTHLLNRRSYESRPASLRGQAVIYYFDVDEFKSVNDTFGHGVGDAVLAEVGSTIYAVFSKAGYCYRIGGDEFCVIAQISDTAAEKYLSEFLRELTARRVKNERLPRVSVGYACFNPVLGSVEDAIKRADRMMSHYKRKRKSEALTNDDTVKS
ncbi:GGDEF domain-containing protein [Hominicoprocola fusiformis]|jgi:diguanylate cyclase (GGDEF)-like protein|nr:GGDEF domain-containing protein [Hominicoprocola fusiformis]